MKTFFSALLYYLVIKPISLLPFFLLYRVSDGVFLLFYYVIPYRKKVVLDNLRRSFPEKTKEEINRIGLRFYRHFADLVLESLKNFSISEKQVEKRFLSTGTEIIEKYHSQGKGMMICGGHYANWEFWALAAARDFKHPIYALYTRLTNPFFDQKMKQTRGKFGLELISTKDYRQFMAQNAGKTQFSSVFGFDQSPSNPDKAVWVNFLGRDTAAQYGVEKYAKEYKLPVIYGHLKKVSRGHYSIHYALVTDTPADFEKGMLIQRLYEILEKDIREKPEYWLWTHKRWKHHRQN